MISFLLDRGADINAVSVFQDQRRTLSVDAKGHDEVTLQEQHFSALQTAVKVGRPDVAQLLLNRGADANAETFAGLTPLMYAVDNGRHMKEVQDALHERQIKWKRQERTGSAGALGAFNAETATNVDSRRMNPDGTEMLYAKNRISVIDSVDLEARGPVDPRVEVDRKALETRRDKKQPEIIAVLISSGADINRQDTVFGLTPLMQAIKAGRVEAVRLLVEAGARLDLKDFEGRTATDYAAANPDPGIAVVLNSVRQ